MTEWWQQKRRSVWFWILCVLGVFAVAFLFIPTSSTGSSGAGQQSGTPAHVSGQLPTIQYVGQTTDIRLTVRNGTSDLPHLVIDASGCMDHWVLDSMASNVGAGHDVATGVYDFGSLLNGATWRGTLTVTPKDAGNHDCDLTVYGDLDASTGTPKGDPLDSLTGKVAINP